MPTPGTAGTQIPGASSSKPLEISESRLQVHKRVEKGGDYLQDVDGVQFP